MNTIKSAIFCCLITVMAGGAWANELAVSGIFGNKAVLVIDNNPPRTLSIGQTSPEGVKLLAIDAPMVTVEIDGERLRLRLGEQVVQQAGRSSEEVSIYADDKGMFRIEGQINGQPIKFVVDTGATVVAIGQSDAQRLKIDLKRATKALTQTAGGVREISKVTLNSVKVGSIQLHNVEAAVLKDDDLPYALLGASFLQRTEMKREGNHMQLKKKY
jgi:aspartyl protease family protein